MTYKVAGKIKCIRFFPPSSMLFAFSFMYVGGKVSTEEGNIYALLDLGTKNYEERRKSVSKGSQFPELGSSK